MQKNYHVGIIGLGVGLKHYEVFKKIKADGGEYSLFALTDKGYEKLSLNFADIRNKLAEQRQIILSYKDYYESE